MEIRLFGLRNTDYGLREEDAGGTKHHREMCMRSSDIDQDQEVHIPGLCHWFINKLLPFAFKCPVEFYKNRARTSIYAS